jgi:hypothetical protein
MTQSLQVITSRLLTPEMCVDTHVTSSTGQRFPLTVRDVLLGLGITVLLGHTEINHVNDIGGFGPGPANKEVVRLDISVDEVLLVNRLNARKLVPLATG